MRPSASKTARPVEPARAPNPPWPPKAAETGLRVGGPADGSCLWDCASNACRMAPVSARICASIWGSDPPVSGRPMSNACRMAPVSSSICGIVGASGSPPNMDPKKSNMESDPSSASASSSMPRACRMAPVSSSICASIWESVPPVSGLPTSSISRMAPVSSSICVIVWVSDCAWASSTTYAPDIAMQHAIAKMQCAAARGHARLGPRGLVRLPALRSMASDTRGMHMYLMLAKVRVCPHVPRTLPGKPTGRDKTYAPAAGH